MFDTCAGTLRKAMYVRTTYVASFPGLRPDFISQPWRKVSPRLRDKVWAEAWERGYHVRTYASSTVSRHFGAETKIADPEEGNPPQSNQYCMCLVFIATPHSVSVANSDTRGLASIQSIVTVGKGCR